MKIYRVSYADKQDAEHKGYSYHTSRAAAEKAVRDCKEHKQCEITTTELTPTKKGIIAYLERYADHPDNG